MKLIFRKKIRQIEFLITFQMFWHKKINKPISKFREIDYLNKELLFVNLFHEIFSSKVGNTVFNSTNALP